GVEGEREGERERKSYICTQGLQ
ncbi:hypothetical protein KIPB_016343, partial [Kipferlia bialata]